MKKYYTDLNEKKDAKINIKAGDIILVKESGGVFSRNFEVSEFKKKFPNATRTEIARLKPVKLIFDGVPVMDKNQTFILFAKQYNGPVTDESIINAIKFKKVPHESNLIHFHVRHLSYGIY